MACETAARQIDVPISTVRAPLSKATIAAVMRDIQINTLTQLPSEATNKRDSVIEQFASHAIEGVNFLYDWASHRLTVRVGYTTKCFLMLMTSSKQYWQTLPLVKRRGRILIPKRAIIFSLRNKCTRFLFYDSGETVKVASSLHHV
jgi:hypothetical protein